MHRREFLKAGAVLALASLGLGAAKPPPGSRPNILWIMLEDWNPDLSCYGTPGLHTPNIDRLAAEGVRYTACFTTAPVCSPARSAMLTGHHQNYIGCHQHRTAKEDKQPLPHGIRPIPALLQEAGYFTAVGCGADKKVDRNFADEPGFAGAHWRERAPGQPFFGQATIGTTHRRWQRDAIRPIDEATVELPPYYPDVPLVRRDWANGLESCQIADREVGAILAELERDGLLDQTLVILIGDNGSCMPRDKQFLYDGGLHVPLIMRWPAHIQPGTVCDDLVSSLDISAAIVELAGATPAHPLHGTSLFDDAIRQQEFIFAARDKMDDTHDCMRAVRSRRFKYISNLMPERAWCQFNAYKEGQYPTLAALNALHLQGRLTPEQDRFMADHKPPEELFDLQQDPHELHNLADDPAFAGELARMRQVLADWRRSINDQDPSEEFRQGGWPSRYPTRSQEHWEQILEAWQPWVFRAPGSKVEPPKELLRATSLLNSGLLDQP
jgi:uncharacterized sulfatase